VKTIKQPPIEPETHAMEPQEVPAFYTSETRKRLEENGVWDSHSEAEKAGFLALTGREVRADLTEVRVANRREVAEDQGFGMGV
jgi:hypothetical protein